MFCDLPLFVICVEIEWRPAYRRAIFAILEVIVKVVCGGKIAKTLRFGKVYNALNRQFAVM